ncbi:MAG TPA: ABC transporter ATP-binding protein [Candidatus Methylomirabilis sp.]|nr:ABC transporter ATP-binding protein [Candidatus Methylomirabilis sp.]
MALVEVEGLTKAFGGVIANKDICLRVEQGETVGLIGPNGSGKTTFFGLVSGDLRPDSGSVRFQGEDITGLPPHVINGKGIARTFQKLRPFGSMTVLENVMVGGLPRMSIREARQEALRLIELVGLSRLTHSLASALSTGQRKRLELARAMATRPKLLLLDEVTGGVDHKSIPALVALIQRLRQEGVTLVVIEHSMKVVMQLANRIIALHLGEKICDDLPERVATDRRVIELYLGKAYATHR